MPANATDDRMLKIAKALLTQTTNGNITWQATDDPEAFLYSGSKTSIIIDTNNKRAPQPFWLKILNQNGTVVETLYAVQVFGDDDTKANYELLKALHSLARRNALKVDAVIDGVLQELEDLPPF